jgi:RimJ/RimL family protein N-acetyltransferase
MSSVESIFPLLGLRIVAGPVELRAITDDLIGPLTDLALEGIHGADEMPFTVPWSIEGPKVLPLNAAKYYWGKRTEFSPATWSADMATFWEGNLVGAQGIFSSNFLVTKTAETGSWLGRGFQGRGIGTAMRQVICAFGFDALGAELMVSGAFADNEASRAVSRKVGYEDQGWSRVERLGQPVTMNRFVLAPESFLRFEHDNVVEGLAPFRRSIGLSD